MKIGFYNTDWSNFRDAENHRTYGGSGWYRLGMPYEYLQRNNVDVCMGDEMGIVQETCELIIKDNTGAWHGGLDVVVIGRWMDEHAADCVRYARSAGQVVIGDVDDWYDGLLPSNGAWGASHPRRNESSNRNHYRAMLAACSGLTCSTPFLVEKMRLINERCVLVRNAIDLERWKVADLSDPPIVGWVGGVPWRSGDLEAVPIGQWCNDNDVAFFHGGHVGGQQTAAEKLGIRTTVKTLPMQSIQRYPRLFTKFNIGIVPLRDVGFNHAKSCVKGMEYAASGLPFIASSLPDYGFAAAHGVGQTARRWRDWQRALNRLLDVDERRRQGALNREAVTAFDMADRWHVWRDVYEEIAA